ncbi:MAG: redoxin domain-containing protein [Xanthomonadales bacterium]|nr:redoxin domain-containing protein [Xanthomonadales bacterium]
MDSSGQSLYLHEWPEGLEWVNCEAPPRLSDLRGKVIILICFNGSSVLCQQQLEELRELQNHYHDGVALVGIHTPKYSHETRNEAVLKAINRMFIRFPVANDREYAAWRSFSIPAWPCATLIDCDGQIIASYAGYGRADEITARVENLLDRAGLSDQRNYEPVPGARKPEPRKALSFPSRIIATRSQLYLSDSGSNKIYELNFDGVVSRVFGTGNAGLWDARGSEAGFNNPQGLAYGAEMLYVADCGNHSIRRIRLVNGEVETVCGTGKLAPATDKDFGLPKETPLASPLDVAVHQERLFIAAAGFQQVLELDMGRDRLRVFAGNGRADLADGSGGFASFAEPCGLSVARDTLFVADSGNSALRAIRIADTRVQTLLGLGPFDYGDVDGNATLARLQHPMAVFADGARGLIWICDTYNSKIKVYSLAKGEVKTLNLKYGLNEPRGICVANNAVWIANTGAHEVLRLDLKTGRLSRLPVGEGGE